MTNPTHLPRSTPEAQGIDSAAILRFVQAAEAEINELHSFMLLRRGSVVAEGWWSPYRPELSHMLFSLSKSFTSSGIGLAVGEGRLSVDDPVISFFPDDLPPEISPNLAAMRVRHLLSMSTGHAEDSLPRIERDTDSTWTKTFLACPVDFEPGTHFVYNSGATYMLSAIIQKITGVRLLDYLQPRLFAPLGIEGATWQQSPQGIDTGGWGLSIKTEDIAKFIQLYLQKGNWNGTQLLDEAWIAQATSKQVSNGDDPNSDWAQGYGFQFWRCRHNSYRGDGAFGQFGVVLPEKDAAIAITAGVADMQSVLNLVWEHLLPAMSDTPLPPNPAAHGALTETLESLTLKPLQGSASVPQAALVSGRQYTIDESPLGAISFVLDFSEPGAKVTLQTAFGELIIPIGQDEWLEGEIPLPNITARYAISGAWTSDDTYTILLRFIETPFYFTITSSFHDDQVDIHAAINMFFTPIEYQMVGRQI